MGLFKNRLELVDTQVGVHLRGRQVGVAEQFFNGV